jgi:hypothetical protein
MWLELVARSAPPSWTRRDLKQERVETARAVTRRGCYLRADVAVGGLVAATSEEGNRLDKPHNSGRPAYPDYAKRRAVWRKMSASR